MRQYPSGEFNDGYIGFWVKIVGQQQNAYGGSKFLKLFSSDYDGTVCANTTFSQTYHTGLHRDINHGNGSSTSNDTQQFFSYDGNKTAGAVGTITDYAGSFYLQDGEWHWWECRVKFNTDNNEDGAYAVWIDGVNKINVINVKNRHNDNARDWNMMHFVGWIEGAYEPASEYYVYIDRVTTSDEYIGVPDSEDPPISSSTASGTAAWR